MHAQVFVFSPNPHGIVLYERQREALGRATMASGVLRGMLVAGETSRWQHPAGNERLETNALKRAA
jgi:hypothetical protein